MTKEDWLTAFCAQCSTNAPSREEIETLLSFAGSVAHASERTAAPIACWLVGRAGIDLERALELALRMEASAVEPGDA